MQRQLARLNINAPSWHLDWNNYPHKKILTYSLVAGGKKHSVTELFLSQLPLTCVTRTCSSPDGTWELMSLFLRWPEREEPACGLLRCRCSASVSHPSRIFALLHFEASYLYSNILLSFIQPWCSERDFFFLYSSVCTTHDFISVYLSVLSDLKVVRDSCNNLASLSFLSYPSPLLSLPFLVPVLPAHHHREDYYIGLTLSLAK